MIDLMMHVSILLSPLSLPFGESSLDYISVPFDQVRINEADGYLYYIIQSTLKTHRLFSSNLWQDTASFSSPIWDLLSTSHFRGHTTGLHAAAKTTILPRILQRFDMYAKQE